MFPVKLIAGNEEAQAKSETPWGQGKNIRKLWAEQFSELTQEKGAF